MQRRDLRDGFIIALGMVAVIVACMILAAAIVETIREPTIVRIEEDSPEWDCRTMGNQICGPMPTNQTGQ